MFQMREFIVNNSQKLSKMTTEIEHKYLVIDQSYETMATECHHIMQGYLSTECDRTVRVRTYDNRGFVTIKSRNKGASRMEFEYEIPYDDAALMLNELCLQPIIDKYRYIVHFDGEKWEVDRFEGHLHGLVMAEIEIPDEEHTYSLPPFVGKNVTGDARYYNSCLSTATSMPCDEQ